MPRVVESIPFESLPDERSKLWKKGAPRDGSLVVRPSNGRRPWREGCAQKNVPKEELHLKEGNCEENVPLGN